MTAAEERIVKAARTFCDATRGGDLKYMLNGVPTSIVHELFDATLVDAGDSETKYEGVPLDRGMLPERLIFKLAALMQNNPGKHIAIAHVENATLLFTVRDS